MRACFTAVTANGAKALHLDGYGIEPGCRADLVLLQARDPIEAIRLKATRLKVIRRGTVIAESGPHLTEVRLGGSVTREDFFWPKSGA